MRVYTGKKTREIVFPLGGIGSGSVGLGGNGRFSDWEIFNHPDKGSLNGYTHLAVKVQDKDGIHARVLQGDLQKDLMGQYQKETFHGYGYGPDRGTMAGLPHFRYHTFREDFPFASLRFSDPDFPCPAELTAFSPFIPTDSRNSSLPAAFFTVTLRNPTDRPMQATAAFSLTNPYAHPANRAADLPSGSAALLWNRGAEGTPEEGALALGAFGKGAECGVQTHWYRGGWMDGITTFWRQWSTLPTLPERTYDGEAAGDTATVYAAAPLPPGGKAVFHFILCWYNPICQNTWDEGAKDENGVPLCWRNYYATLFPDALSVLQYCKSHFTSLQKRSRAFPQAMAASTLPPVVREAACANLCVLHSPTVLRLEDGTLWGWEGVHEKSGSCEGSCTHVWNYAYALCYLFPDLERSLRVADYRYNLRPDGHMRFRLPLPPTKERGWEMPCVDGQMGGIIKTYREWKLCGSDAFLRALWPDVKRSLLFAQDPANPYRWDADRDGVLEGRQHHTLDQELFGPSAWLEGLYLCALRAGAAMARAMGEEAQAQEWEALYESGRAFTERELFNGSHYIQKVNLQDRQQLRPYGEAYDQYWNAEAGEVKYQIGEGSSIDQLCGQWHANLCGLGDIFDPDHRRTALAHMFRHNFRPSMRPFCNLWRNYAVNDEAGAAICVYAPGERQPALPVPYADECMHGFEYEFAGLLFSEGMRREGLAVVRSVRERYDGEKRNPYNEMECGSNYARSMASYALIPLLSGFAFDACAHAMGFAPRLPLPFAAPFGFAGAFGQVRLEEGGALLRVAEGTLPLRTLTLPQACIPASPVVLADGVPVPVMAEGNVLHLPDLRIARTLEVRSHC